MKILFIHKAFPAQFGHIGHALAASGDFECTFLSRNPPEIQEGIERIQFGVTGGARKENHHCSRNFENATWESAGILETLRERPDVQPDVIVAHSGFFQTTFLRELYDCAIVNYFEYYYRPDGSDYSFREDLPGALDRLTQKNIRLRARNATLLLDLDNCDAGYSPLRWQRDRLPRAFHDKVSVIFDGVDTSVWKPVDEPTRKIGEREIPADVKVVTYVARGLEPIRGFDVFMKLAKRLGEMRDDVVFVVVGRDKVYYGIDDRFLDGKTFKEWVLSRDDYDLERFVFVEWMERDDLVDLFSLSDLHVYLTTPFVLSWSLVNALSCGATVLASRVGPVPEVIQHGVNGFLAPYFAIEEQAELAHALLDDDELRKRTGRRARELVEQRMGLDVCLPKIRDLIVGAYEGSRDRQEHDYRLEPVVSPGARERLGRAVMEGRSLTQQPHPLADLLERPSAG